MKTIDPWAKGESFEDRRVVEDDRHGNRYTRSAERVIVGHCPECDAVLVVFNDHESWPLVGCKCGWTGATAEFVSTRFESGGLMVQRSA